MNSKEIFDYMWSHKPFWERNSDEERAFKIKLKEIEEHYSQPQTT